MKNTIQLLITGTLLCGTLAFAAADNILTQLDIAEQDAKEYIFSNFQEGDLSFPYSTTLKKLATGKKAEAVKAMGDYIRQYTNSPAFNEQYQQARAAAKPEEPANAAEKIGKRLEELKHDITETEKDMKGANNDMKKLYELTLQQLKQEQKALQDPKDKLHQDYVSGLTGANHMDEGQYKETMAEYNKQYPATVKELVKSRLQSFLTMTADMNFNAPMITKGKMQYFADPTLEAKDGLWKRCFRSGPETINAARAYAKQWLKELN